MPTTLPPEYETQFENDLLRMGYRVGSFAYFIENVLENESQEGDSNNG
jgi:hypothetical protein